MSESDVEKSDAQFHIKIASTGVLYEVPGDKSIVEVLWANGFDIDTSCETGLCATCMTRYVEGEPDHRDMVLDEDERSEYLCVCCSRSRSPVLVLDL